MCWDYSWVPLTLAGASVGSRRGIEELTGCCSLHVWLGLGSGSCRLEVHKAAVKLPHAEGAFCTARREDCSLRAWTESTLFQPFCPKISSWWKVESINCITYPSVISILFSVFLYSVRVNFCWTGILEQLFAVCLSKQREGEVPS